VLHLSASFSLFRLFFLFFGGVSLSCLVVAGVAEVLCVCVCARALPAPLPLGVCVCVCFCFPAKVHCCTEVKCVVLREEAPWFGIQVSCWPLLLLLLLSFSFVFYLFVCCNRRFNLVFVGVVTVVFVVALCVYVSLSLSLSQECWRSWELVGCLFFRELRSGSCVQNEGD
jgi:hypothetical protein